MNRHRFDPFSFVFGAFFVMVALTVLLGDRSLLGVLRAGWPVILVALGLGLLLSARRRDTDRAD